MTATHSMQFGLFIFTALWISLYKLCLFNHSPINEHLHYLQFGAITNSDDKNILLKCLLITIGTHFAGLIPRRRTITDHIYVQLKQATPNSFLNWFYHFILPQQYPTACTAPPICTITTGTTGLCFSISGGCDTSLHFLDYS